MKILNVKKAEEKTTELVFIIDRSGSMAGLEKDTIGGFNSMLKKQKADKEKCFVSTVLFDSEISVICDRQDIKDVKPMTENEYCVGGCTALLDALGGAIHHIVIFTNMREKAMCRIKHFLWLLPMDLKMQAENTIPIRLKIWWKSKKINTNGNLFF